MRNQMLLKVSKPLCVRCAPACAHACKSSIHDTFPFETFLIILEADGGVFSALYLEGLVARKKISFFFF